jgi:hypothetical protein
VVRSVCLALLVACGSSGGSSPATSTTAAAVTAPPTDDGAADREREQREAQEAQAKHDEIAATHRVAELEQQNAFAASCDEPKPWNKHPRCFPSCYPTDEPDKRAEKKLVGAAIELQHIVCRPSGAVGDVPFAIVDELGGGKLVVKPGRGRFPKPHGKRAWQAEVEAWFRDQPMKIPKTDGVIVKGNWRNRSHPLSKEKLSCVTVSHFARGVRGKLDECGAVAKSGVTCEAAGSAAARAINVVHFRVAEARRLQKAGKKEQCLQAALEAIAVARGLPRWRQFKKLNVNEWNDKLVYKTRFDGVLDEDRLFAAVAALGSEAEGVYGACGGSLPTTTAEAEQSFHTCW